MKRTIKKKALDEFLTLLRKEITTVLNEEEKENETPEQKAARLKIAKAKEEKAKADLEAAKQEMTEELEPAAPVDDEGGDEEGGGEEGGGEETDMGGEEGGEEGDEEDQESARVEDQPEEMVVNFNASRVRRYNKAKFGSDEGVVTGVSKKGLKVKVLPDNVEILVNFSDIT